METKKGNVIPKFADLFKEQGRYQIFIRFTEGVEGYLNLFDYKRSILNDGIVFVTLNAELPLVKHTAPGEGNEFEFEGATRDPQIVALFKATLYRIEAADANNTKPKLGFIDIDNIDHAWAEVEVPPSGEEWTSAKSLGLI